MKQLVILVALALSTGCATMFSGSSEPITFKSIPEGARVEVNGANVGRTPLTMPLAHGFNPPQVRFSLDGYETQQVILQSSFNGTAMLNLFFWPGFIIDTATGNLMKYEVLTYELTLEERR